MNKKYWQQFYKKEHIKEPTDFAVFCQKYIFKKDNGYIVDLGCGNGRDSYYFAEKGHEVLAVDYALNLIEKKHINFIQMELNEFFNVPKAIKPDVIYSRFLLHAITEKTLENLLNWSGGLFCAEFRADTDKPKVYKDHKRNLINGEKLLKMLVEKKYKIWYYKRGKGMAKYKNEDPEVIRVIAQKI